MTVEKRLSKLEEEVERKQPTRRLIPGCIFVRPIDNQPVTQEQVEKECREHEAEYGRRPDMVLVSPAAGQVDAPDSWVIMPVNNNRR